MLPDSPIARRMLAIAAVVLVVAALATVVVVGGSGTDDALTAGSSGSTTSAPDGEATAGSDAPSPTETSAAPTTEAPPGTVGAAGGDAGPAASTTAPPATDPPAEPAAAPDPGPNTPPQAGTYLYAFSREGGDEGTQNGERNTVVEDAGEAGGERRQRIRQDEDEQGSFVSDVAWRADGLYVLKTTFTFGDQSSECDWQPDFRMLAAPLAPGTTWSYDTSCTATFQGTPVKIDRTGEFTVVEATRIDVAGTTVDVWKIQSVEETTFGAFGSAKEETTAYFSPRHGLTVKSMTKASGSGQGQTRTVTEESQIKNLSPQ